jgi:hypothetical protein
MVAFFDCRGADQRCGTESCKACNSGHGHVGLCGRWPQPSGGGLAHVLLAPSQQ